MTSAARDAMREARLLDREPCARRTSRSPASPQSFGATRTRSTRSGSTTSTVIGPTRRLGRARRGASREARTTHCRPPRTTLNAASITRRFGYTPSAAAKNRSPARRVAVEEVAVVEIAVAGRGLRDRLGRLVQRVVVEAGQHGLVSPSARSRRASRASVRRRRAWPARRGAARSARARRAPTSAGAARPRARRRAPRGAPRSRAERRRGRRRRRARAILRPPPRRRGAASVDSPQRAWIERARASVRARASAESLSSVARSARRLDAVAQVLQHVDARRRAGRARTASRRRAARRRAASARRRRSGVRPDQHLSHLRRRSPAVIASTIRR